MNPFHKNSGFSLLEVLVAFSITALALGVLFQIYATGTQSVIAGKEYSKAVLIAQSKLDTFGDFSEPTDKELSGEENIYNWVTTVSSYPEINDTVKDTGISIRLVAVKVSWQGRVGLRSVTLNTLRLVQRL